MFVERLELMIVDKLIHKSWYVWYVCLICHILFKFLFFDREYHDNKEQAQDAVTSGSTTVPASNDSIDAKLVKLVNRKGLTFGNN